MPSVSRSLFASLFIHCTISATWDYHNASQWIDSYPECGGNHQSPIDISLNSELSDCETPLSLSWTSETVHFAVRNKGHSLQALPFEISDEDGTDINRLEALHHRNDTNIRLQNLFYDTYKSAVNSEYCFDSLHFHWGNDSEHGSEHTMNGNHYPLEVHLVHYSCDYYMVTDAVSAYAGDQLTEMDDAHVLAVVGVIFEIGEANPVLAEILSDVIVDGVQYYDPEGEQSNLIQLFYTEFNPMDLLPENKEFVGYQGSLTTPPCYETVRWHVLKERMTVSEEQMAQFRLLANGDDFIAPNWRPVQQLGERNIYQCHDELEPMTVEKEVTELETTSDGADTTDDAQIWFIIGVVFICLFVIAALYSAYLSYMLYCNKESAYQQAKNEDPEDLGAGSNNANNAS